MSQTDANGFQIVGSSAPPSGGASLSAPSHDANGFQLIGGSSSPTFPNNGNPPPKDDSDDPWYKKAWDFAQTPLTEQFGIPSERAGAGGFERAGEHILSGLTSPLSLALAAATFGTGGFIESAGASTLREAGLSAAEIANASKASEVAANAYRDLKPVEPVVEAALKAGGHDISLLQKAKDALGPVDLTDRLGTESGQNALSRLGLDSAERKALEEGTLSAADRSKIASANGGFTEDEITALGKAGDTVQKAKAGFTPVEDAVRNAGLDVDQWKTAQDTLFKNGLTGEDLTGGNALERGAFQIIRRTVPDLPVAASVKIAKTANAVLNAGFTLQQFESAAALSPRFLDALKEGDSDKAWEYGTEALVGGALGLAGAPHALHAAGELFDPLLEPGNKLRPSDQTLAYNRAHQEREALQEVGSAEARKVDAQIRDALGHTKATTPEQKQLDLATVFHQVVTGGDQNKAAAWHNALAEAAGDSTRIPLTGNAAQYLPENVADQIKSSGFIKQTEAYQRLTLDSLKAVAEDALTPEQKAAAQIARDEQAKNFEIGSANDLLHHQIDDYMTRHYKDTNEAGKVVAAQAKTGRFATNVTMARQRVYDSHITALLKSPKEMDFDAAANVAQGRDSLIKAAANKQFIDTLRDKFTRASDGRPAVVLSGSGQVVHGPEGEDPATYIQPDRVRKIQVADSVVQHLTQTGDLARYLDDGSLKEITPKVYPDTLDTAIQKLTEQVRRIKDPHLGAMADTKLKVLQQAKALKGQAQADALTTYNEGIPKMYAWDPQDYIKLDNAAMKGWNFVTNDTSGNGVFVRSDIKVHPEFAENLQNRLGLETSSLAKHPVSAAILKANTKLKETLLSLSPFHMAQLALRGVMVGVNPFTLNTPDILNGEKIDPSDPNSVSIIRKAVEHGLTTGTDYKAEQQMSEGVSSGAGLLRKIPGVGKVVANSLDWYQDFLFKRFMPALKANAAEKLFRDYQTKNPDWNVDRVAKATALHTNDTFGGINWKAMGRSATTQDWGRLLLLAPDWMESEMRSMGRLFNKDEGSLGRAQTAKMAMGLWGIARVLNYANTGNFHNEAPFGLAVKNKDGKEIIYSMRTLPTDMLHAAADPANFIKGRLSPTIGMGQELLTQRDRYGRKLGPEDLYADIFRNMAPIPLQAIGQAVSGTGPEVGSPAQVVKALGGTAQAYQTPAQKMAADLASTHSEDGVVDPALQARHRRVMQFEDQVRNGEMPMSDLMRLTYQSDQLKETELKKIQLNLKQTQGMSADMASLYSRASRLPAKEYLQLLDTMNTSEKTALVPLTIQTQKKYLNKAKKDETPTERAKDPVFQRFLNMIPQQPQARPQPGPQASVEYPHTATNPDTGHKIGSHDGVNWFDHETGEAFNG